MQRRPRVLLTTVFRPFSTPGRYNVEDGERFLDYFTNRLTVESGMFVLHDDHPTVPLHIIGSNIDADVTALETPTEHEFREELTRKYDVLGISFYTLHFPKLVRMIALARHFAPETKIIVGGFGTALHDIELLEIEGVCRGEGVRCIREFLGQDVSGQMEHPLVPVHMRLRLALRYPELGSHPSGIVVNGFGCPHACEFCLTSSYYGHRRIPFLATGDELFEVMKRYFDESGIRDFLIYEEDFLLYREQVRRFGSLVSKNRAPFSYGCFAAVRSLCEHEVSDLVRGGLSHVWIGVESMSSPFKKSVGRPVQDLFDELNHWGITTTASLIAGLDHHSRENMHQEYEYVASLFPSTVQISHLIAAPGTPLTSRLTKEGRLVQTDARDATLYSETVRHPGFEQGELRESAFQGYEYIYQRLGPALFRMMRTWLEGYRTLRRVSDPGLRLRAELLRERVNSVRPFFMMTHEFLPNRAVQEEVRETLREMDSNLGPPSEAQVRRAELIRRIFRKEHGRLQEEGPLVYEPETRRSHYSLTRTSRNQTGLSQRR
ncbi:B12-binding domain-containing radical SAM protein [Thermodesulfobacteriota bacterium]